MNQCDHSDEDNVGSSLSAIVADVGIILLDSSSGLLRIRTYAIAPSMKL
jgi:hypothetical protein